MSINLFRSAFSAVAYSAFTVASLHVSDAQQPGSYGTYQPNQTVTTPIRPNRTEYADPSRSAQGSPQYIPIGGAASNLNGGNSAPPNTNAGFDNNGFSSPPAYAPPESRDLNATLDADTYRRTTQGSPGYNPATSATDQRGNSQLDNYRDPRNAPADTSFASGLPGPNDASDLLPNAPPSAGFPNDPNRYPLETPRTQTSIPDPMRDVALNGGLTNSASPTAGSRQAGTTPLSLLLLLASISANVYLGWIAFDTYNRYQDLVGDIKMSRSRRERGPRNSERDYSSEDAEVLIS